jgi:hypothetical protein
MPLLLLLLLLLNDDDDRSDDDDSDDDDDATRICVATPTRLTAVRNMGSCYTVGGGVF